MNIGKSIKIAMAHREINQTQLSEKAEISQVTISKIMQKKANPSLTIINELAKAMDYSLGDFINLGED